MGGTLPIPSCLFILTALLFSSSFQPCHLLNTAVVDGLAELKTATLHVQGSPVFEHLQKFPGRVIAPDLSPGFPPLPTPPPTAGGDLPTLPSHHGWVGWSSPTPAPEASPLVPGEGLPSTAPMPGSAGAGGGIPFISSNPAVPLPTGETDTATIRPLPTPGDETQVVGLGTSSSRIQIAVMVVSVMMSSALGLWL